VWAARFIFTAHFGKADSAVEEGAGDDPRLRDLEVLVTDRNAVTRRYFETLLNGWHMNYRGASSGAEALR